MLLYGFHFHDIFCGFATKRKVRTSGAENKASGQ
jgi:hypothetical protein